MYAVSAILVQIGASNLVDGADRDVVSIVCC